MKEITNQEKHQMSQSEAIFELLAKVAESRGEKLKAINYTDNPDEIIVETANNTCFFVVLPRLYSWKKVDHKFEFKHKIELS